MKDDKGQSVIHIRLAIPDDVTAIASVLRESFAEFVDLYTPAAFTATTPSSEIILRRLDEGPSWIAAINGDIAGTVSGVGRDNGLYIRSMAVLPSARGYGLGHMLLQQVEAYALEMGFHHLILSTTPFLNSAIRLYERAGFEHSDAGPADLHGTPLITMIKSLE